MKLLFENWRRFLNEATIAISPKPRAFVLPHASPEYSGHIALELIKDIPDHNYDSILILGIDHQGGESGIYVGSDYNPDEETLARIREAGFGEVAGDHSIGHLLPLIESFSDLPIAPFVITDYDLRISDTLMPLITNNTLIVASTDLSHYNPLEVAGEIDHQTILNIQKEGPEIDACGSNAIRVLYDLIDERLELVDYDTSAHLEGDTERVVGYAAFQAGGFSEDLLGAKDAVTTFLETGEVPAPSENMRAAFVGITKNGELQGSMGQTRPELPANIAAIEAFRSTLTDPRMKYDPNSIMTPGSGFEVKIRLFSDMQPTSLEEVIIGKDGIYVESGEKSAVFLPEVPTKEQWNHSIYLEELLNKGQIMDDNYDLFKFQTESIMVIT